MSNLDTFGNRKAAAPDFVSNLDTFGNRKAADPNFVSNLDTFGTSKAADPDFVSNLDTFGIRKAADPNFVSNLDTSESAKPLTQTLCPTWTHSILALVCFYIIEKARGQSSDYPLAELFARSLTDRNFQSILIDKELF